MKVKTFDLKEKVVLITGGYGHLGKAATLSLLYHGALVYVLGRNQEKFDEVFAEMEESQAGSLHFVSCDISKSDSIQQAFKSVYEKEGRIDVLVNNAMYSKGQSPERMSDEDWAYGIEGVLSSVFICIREIIPHFKNQGQGKIINVSSMYGIVAPQFEVYDDFPEFLNPPHYGAAKAGVIQLTKYYASYLGRFSINVNAITPGPFPSEQVQESAGFIDALKQKTCLNRIGKPEDLAGAFVFLASDAADFITGQNIIVDGGWICR